MGDAYNSMVDWYKSNSGAARVEYEGVQELHGETPVKTRKFLPPETPPEEPPARYQPKEPPAPQLLPPFDSLLELLGAYVTDPPGSLDFIEQLPEVRAKSLPELVCWAADERRTQLLQLLKDAGVEVLAQRQKFCGVLARALRENRIREFRQYGANRVEEHWETHCGQCGGKKSETRKLYHCTRCRAVKYCSAQCQKRAWAAHKASCVPVKKG